MKITGSKLFISDVGFHKIKCPVPIQAVVARPIEEPKFSYSTRDSREEFFPD